MACEDVDEDDFAGVMTLTRTTRNPRATFGELRLGTQLLVITLENTALIIPAGIFPVTLDYSPHFQMLLPRLHDVPHRTDIEIHPANFVVDLKGCIGVGRYVSGEAEIAESRIAMGIVLTRWAEWHGEMLEIRDAP